MESLGLVNPKIVYTCWDFVYFSLRPQPLDKYESRSMETRPRHCVFASRGQRGWTIAFLKRGQFPSCIEIGHAPTAAMIDRRKMRTISSWWRQQKLSRKRPLAFHPRGPPAEDTGMVLLY
ncbi:hypothetical protein PVAP13_8KG294700 [Panicum virgatum]|uniref:Uncharacterized protein n=1 Tax=Panicum virgatum TaxID=38727 RepID=A0A8T0PWU6_PANVG|nr:hypothetical protein PVAP13_8KG294700 [Panicum virgatum]